MSVEKLIKNQKTRRQKGTGTILEYEPGKWLARITINGKQFPFYGASEKEVTKKLSDFRQKIRQGQTDNKRISYEKFLQLWLGKKKAEIKIQSYDRILSLNYSRC